MMCSEGMWEKGLMVILEFLLKKTLYFARL